MTRYPLSCFRIKFDESLSVSFMIQMFVTEPQAGRIVEHTCTPTYSGLRAGTMLSEPLEPHSQHSVAIHSHTLIHYTKKWRTFSSSLSQYLRLLYSL
jgi:hypothetical protein